MNALTTFRWLKAAAAFVAIAGIVFAFGAHPATAWPLLVLADLTFWPFDGAQSLSAPETRLAYGIIGGVMAGWGVMIWLVVDRLWSRDPQFVRLAVLAGVGVWFVVDCTASLAAGAPGNLVVNLGFLALFALPLIRRPAP